MNLNYIIKAFPFLSTFLLIIFLNLANQKESAKLKILIWETPTLSLGTYLAISTGTGFILSYFFTINLVKIKQIGRIKYKNNSKNDETTFTHDQNFENQYDKTLIERDIKDPSPTINASFRVIAKTNTNKYSNHNNYTNEYYADDLSVESEDEDYIQEFNSDNKTYPILNDWDDDTYKNW